MCSTGMELESGPISSLRFSTPLGLCSGLFCSHQWKLSSSISVQIQKRVMVEKCVFFSNLKQVYAYMKQRISLIGITQADGYSLKSNFFFLKSLHFDLYSLEHPIRSSAKLSHFESVQSTKKFRYKNIKNQLVYYYV